MTDEKEKNPDWVFRCYKCSHNVYIGKDRVKQMLRLDCPECGEESEENWILIREGNFEKL